MTIRSPSDTTSAPCKIFPEWSTASPGFLTRIVPLGDNTPPLDPYFDLDFGFDADADLLRFVLQVLHPEVHQ
eukprot:CAMPEP_0203702220 /NCGR_PEP_ID=MMETSP0091-20130426/38591_1 /ASSEMBLY_ACC=CAM_ASM_001089 /TAXON_ID=426623 /ORGANISM="Chaetoceros affinis, Strain CCMP159" /LENGTH=71 /DNA_ID=CAMNT_0050576285 /DNA_START=33 /DNA_END=246 /DNA_ORIENTATION=+